MRMNIKRSFLFLVLITIVTVTYSAFVALIAGLLWPEKAVGLILVDKIGRTRGSALIGQEFTSRKYFFSRPSSALINAGVSEASNFGPSDLRLEEAVRKRAIALGDSNFGHLPPDLLLASGSGLDPHISYEAAKFQVEQVANERGMQKEDLLAIMEKHVESRYWRVFGRERVNVFLLNADLDKIEFKED